MPGLNDQAVLDIEAQIRASQEQVLKCVQDIERHNASINKVLTNLADVSKTLNKLSLFTQKIKASEPILIKVKDPLEELKKVRDEYKDRELSGYLRTLILVKIEKCLSLYKDAKISTTFKEIFLKLFNEGLQFKGEFDHLFFNRRMFKEAILKVRDIRWLLLEMEKYPQIFGFNEDDLEVMKQHNASRDNIYLVKKFLKKDGDYEEYYPEEEGGGIKCQYHMTGGLLNGEYKKWYNNGQMNFQGYYKDGERENEYKSWRPTGQLLEHMIYNKDGTDEYKMWYENEQIWMHMYSKGDKREGEYKRWYEDGKLMIQKFYKDGKEEGEFKQWHPNGQLACQGYYREGKLEGEFKSWDKYGQMLEHIIYDNEGKIVKLKRYHNCGVLDIEKTLIENDTYELTRYYVYDGKIHDQVIMVGDKWNGEYNSWWRNGNKCIETTYKDHKLHGNYLYWNEDGTLKEKCFYKDGEKQV